MRKEDVLMWLAEWGKDWVHKSKIDNHELFSRAIIHREELEGYLERPRRGDLEFKLLHVRLTDKAIQLLTEEKQNG